MRTFMTIWPFVFFSPWVVLYNYFLCYPSCGFARQWCCWKRLFGWGNVKKRRILSPAPFLGGNGQHKPCCCFWGVLHTWALPSGSPELSSRSSCCLHHKIPPMCSAKSISAQATNIHFTFSFSSWPKEVESCPDCAWWKQHCRIFPTPNSHHPFHPATGFLISVIQEYHTSSLDEI